MSVRPEHQSLPSYGDLSLSHFWNKREVTVVTEAEEERRGQRLGASLGVIWCVGFTMKGTHRTEAEME